MQAHALVDFHNLPRQVKGTDPASLARSIDAVITSYYPGTREVNIRLYGGWYDDRGLSRDGTKLTQEVGNAFPLSMAGPGGTIRYVRCEIASSLIDSRADLFPSTLRHRHGLDWFIRDPHPPRCLDQSSCTIPIVLKWSRNGCPTPACPVTSIEAFRCIQQKLVDTLICCDLLSLAAADPEVSVFLVSEDDDFIPALLLAGVRGAAVWHVRTKPNKVRLYDQLLLQRGVRLTSL
jgi:hypothetical protein